MERKGKRLSGRSEWTIYRRLGSFKTIGNIPANAVEVLNDQSAIQRCPATVLAGTDGTIPVGHCDSITVSVVDLLVGNERRPYGNRVFSRPALGRLSVELWPLDFANRFNSNSGASFPRLTHFFGNVSVIAISHFKQQKYGTKWIFWLDRET